MAEGIPLALFGFVIVLSFLLSLLALFRVRFRLRLEEEEDEDMSDDDEEVVMPSVLTGTSTATLLDGLGVFLAEVLLFFIVPLSEDSLCTTPLLPVGIAL